MKKGLDDLLNKEFKGAPVTEETNAKISRFIKEWLLKEAGAGKDADSFVVEDVRWQASETPAANFNVHYNSHGVMSVHPSITSLADPDAKYEGFNVHWWNTLPLKSLIKYFDNLTSKEEHAVKVYELVMREFGVGLEEAAEIVKHAANYGYAAFKHFQDSTK